MSEQEQYRRAMRRARGPRHSLRARFWGSIAVYCLCVIGTFLNFETDPLWIFVWPVLPAALFFILGRDFFER
jgi:hypothetical protein